MKYKFNPPIKEHCVGATFSIGPTIEDCPADNPNVPYEEFYSFGLSELMEGVFELCSRTIEETREFLNSLGYEEIK
jgi:hypothetical protein